VQIPNLKGVEVRKVNEIPYSLLKKEILKKENFSLQDLIYVD